MMLAGNRHSEFPSPCGVLVLKLTVNRCMEIGADVKSFRPLAGFWFLNSDPSGRDDYTRIRFPSPCGVLVLKLARLRALQQGVAPVSVPLRGSGS